MMRAWLVSLALLVTGGSLALASSPAGVAPLSDRAGAVAQTSSAQRTWWLTLSPAPGDLTLAEIRFHGSGRTQLSARALHVAVSGPFGADYLAFAVPRFRTPGGSRVLVLLVNRPSPLLDPVSVRLKLSAPRSLGAPETWKLADPFTRPGTTHMPALCSLPLHGAALSDSRLSPLGSRGAPLGGFGVASAVAEAYDAVCGLPHTSAFEHAVTQPALISTPPAPAPPAPSPSPPAPSPTPPVGKLPGEGCQPTPGYACPEAVGSAAPAAPAKGARRVATGGH